MWLACARPFWRRLKRCGSVYFPPPMSQLAYASQSLQRPIRPHVQDIRTRTMKRCKRQDAGGGFVVTGGVSFGLGAAFLLVYLRKARTPLWTRGERQKQEGINTGRPGCSPLHIPKL